MDYAANRARALGPARLHRHGSLRADPLGLRDGIDHVRIVTGTGDDSTSSTAASASVSATMTPTATTPSTSANYTTCSREAGTSTAPRRTILQDAESASHNESSSPTRGGRRHSRHAVVVIFISLF